MAQEIKINEDTRVKLPALVHLCRLGYAYLDRCDCTAPNLSPKSNILVHEFLSQLGALNPELSESDCRVFLGKVEDALQNDDLGREFYRLLSSRAGIRLIDFDNPANNHFACTTECTCQEEKTGEEFRPDITLFVNGLPLAFIEVKKPNNTNGILAEQDRMEDRNRNKTFRPFLNLAQLMIFSNNQEYLLNKRKPCLGAYYATRAEGRPVFNCFREQSAEAPEGKPNFYRDFPFQAVPEAVERHILADNNYQAIYGTPEYETNKGLLTPTNRTLTSLCSKERFLWLLRYGFVYVDFEEKNEKGESIRALQKHVMRYPQMFATLNIRKRLEEGGKSGIIWHTQGSGKTALACFNVRHLTDYYAARAIVPKFYFIVDRIALLEQAQIEFAERGLVVTTASSREELMKAFKHDRQATANASGKPEITVVNIQKFEEDHAPLPDSFGYDAHLQRIYFVDEAHRGYKFDGSFLSNLLTSDKAAVKIALTGTPLLGDENASRKVFGGYIDTYYYNQSIADGYTLKLMREDIESTYRLELQRLIRDAQVRPSAVPLQKVLESRPYCSALLRYIIADLKRSRIQFGGIGEPDNSVAGMIVCSTGPQAREIFKIFNETKPEHGLSAALILYNEDDKDTRKREVEDFKHRGRYDFLIVEDMLLTGFDAARLKKLYLCRKFKDHTLLQALTRVNRPYKDLEYGYIVDFADIRENFKETNEAYLAELKSEVGGEALRHISDLFENPEEIFRQLADIKDVLCRYDTSNVENFRNQLDQVDDKKELQKIQTALESAHSLANVVRTYGDKELQERFSESGIAKSAVLLREVIRRIAVKNFLDAEADPSNADAIAAIKDICERICFSFVKRGEEELRVAFNDFRDTVARVNDAISNNFDRQDEAFQSIFKLFCDYMKRRGVTPVSLADALEKTRHLNDIYAQLHAINLLNDQLRIKYGRDARFARIHKRVLEYGKAIGHPVLGPHESDLVEVLLAVKTILDSRLVDNSALLENDAFFGSEVSFALSSALRARCLEPAATDKRFLLNQIVNEYLSCGETARKTG